MLSSPTYPKPINQFLPQLPQDVISILPIKNKGCCCCIFNIFSYQKITPLIILCSYVDLLKIHFDLEMMKRIKKQKNNCYFRWASRLFINFSTNLSSIKTIALFLLHSRLIVNLLLFESILLQLWRAVLLMTSFWVLLLKI